MRERREKERHTHRVRESDREKEETEKEKERDTGKKKNTLEQGKTEMKILETLYVQRRVQDRKLEYDSC